MNTETVNRFFRTASKVSVISFGRRISLNQIEARVEFSENDQRVTADICLTHADGTWRTLDGRKVEIRLEEAGA